jgi:hypothetical protein
MGWDMVLQMEKSQARDRKLAASGGPGYKGEGSGF